MIKQFVFIFRHEQTKHGGGGGRIISGRRREEQGKSEESGIRTPHLQPGEFVCTQLATWQICMQVTRRRICGSTRGGVESRTVD